MQQQTIAADFFNHLVIKSSDRDITSSNYTDHDSRYRSASHIESYEDANSRELAANPIHTRQIQLQQHQIIVIGKTLKVENTLHVTYILFLKLTPFDQKGPKKGP